MLPVLGRLLPGADVPFELPDDEADAPCALSVDFGETGFSGGTTGSGFSSSLLQQVTTTTERLALFIISESKSISPVLMLTLPAVSLASLLPVTRSQKELLKITAVLLTAITISLFESSTIVLLLCEPLPEIVKR